MNEILRYSSNYYKPILLIIRSLRNGAFYGTKIRGPHALVMIFLFRSGTLKEKLIEIIELTYIHTKNLALFVCIYKTILCLLPFILCKNKLKEMNENIGKPAYPSHSLIAGAIGGYLIWSKYSNVNYQIILYLLSRIIIAITKKLSKDNIYPFYKYQFKTIYPILATIVWSIVMYLFENSPDTLHPSLKKSMDFLYHDSNKWENGIMDFLPSPATAIICFLTWTNVLKKYV